MNRLLADKLRDISKPAGEFSVRVWTTPADQPVATSRDIRVVPTNKDTRYRIGDKISVRFQSTRDCYLTLMNIGTSGKLIILFPNALHRDNRISANQVYEIPGHEYDFEYQLQGPPGIERLKAIATLEKVDLLEVQLASDGSLFLTEAPAAAARDIAVMKRAVDEISSQQWAEDTWEFQVVR